ncbi:MAG: hypothetical protein GKR89_13545 [Candidatus Latescibacteria bacterium]|nr:hypothetical protein [Candidatus Latescibacterota bacterium]
MSDFTDSSQASRQLLAFLYIFKYPMNQAALFDSSYTQRKRHYLEAVLQRLHPVYSADDLAALRIDPVNPAILAQRSGYGFVNRDMLETVLGNLLECIAPGSHNVLEPLPNYSPLETAVDQITDQLYTMVAQSLLAAGDEKQVKEKALVAACALLWELPVLKERAQWNRFASLKDPAVWDAYLLKNCGLTTEKLALIDFGAHLDEAIRRRDLDYYREFLLSLGCDFIFSYQMQLVMSTYPGWRVLFYHDVAHALTRSGPVEGQSEWTRSPIPLLPRAISELGGRYYQADLHPESQIADANFLEHPHRGITTGQTGIIGSGCHIYPCTLGGLSSKIQQRHPRIGNHVSIGTDAGIFGSVQVDDYSVIGPNTEIYGLVEIGKHCRIGSASVIGTIKSGAEAPGKVHLGDQVQVGAGTIIENGSELNLVIPDKADIPARSHVVNDGCGKPRFVQF